jgi:hypothetical protein
MQNGNPFHPHHRHVDPVLTDWVQVEHCLLRPRAAALAEAAPAAAIKKSTRSGAALAEAAPAAAIKKRTRAGAAAAPAAKKRPPPLPLPLRRQLQRQLKLPAYRNASCVENTLRYMFYHLRCGIYAMIRGGRLRMLVPFANSLYRNNWPALTFDADSRHQYYHRKELQYAVRERIIQKEEEWWANGHLICNVRSSQVWGEHFMAELRQMLEGLCERYVVADAEFFLNKRDFPHLSQDGQQEPYPFFADTPLEMNAFSSYCPILSFYTSTQHADLPMPLPQDWSGAREQEQEPAAEVAWSDKIATAFFRGSATGVGITPETNQRLRLATLSGEWTEQHEGVPLLDAGITSWNTRDKKAQGEPVRHIQPDTLSITLQPYVPLAAQRRYRYLLYVDGHCAASRYSQLMRTGSTILKVASQSQASELWFFPLLEPYRDHVPVQADLSDLREQIRWCLEHDKECQAIAQRAAELVRKHISTAGILGFLAQTVNAIGKKQEQSEVVDDHTSLCSGYPAPSVAYLQTLHQLIR